MCIESGYKQVDPIGILACDEESYIVFSSLFEPILKELHPRLDLQQTFTFESINLVTIEQKIR